MLVIRRKQGETLRIGDDIEVEVLELSGTRVVLGIRAPATIRVTRQELLDSADLNRAAVQSAQSLPAEKLSRYIAKIRS